MKAGSGGLADVAGKECVARSGAAQEGCLAPVLKGDMLSLCLACRAANCYQYRDYTQMFIYME